MYEKEIILIDESFIFLRKLTSQECVLWSPKMLKIDFAGGWRAVPCPWLYVPVFLICWAIGPRVKNSKMITGYSRPVGMKFYSVQPFRRSHAMGEGIFKIRHSLVHSNSFLRVFTHFFSLPILFFSVANVRKTTLTLSQTTNFRVFGQSGQLVCIVIAIRAERSITGSNKNNTPTTFFHFWKVQRNVFEDAE